MDKLYIYIYIYHHVTPSARISLTLSRHPSLSSIASGWSSGLHPVSTLSCCIYVVAESPTNGLNHSPLYRKTQQYEVSLDPEANLTPASYTN